MALARTTLHESQKQILRISLIERINLLKRKRNNKQSDIANSPSGLGINIERIERYRDQIKAMNEEIEETADLYKLLSE